MLPSKLSPIYISSFWMSPYSSSVCPSSSKMMLSSFLLISLLFHWLFNYSLWIQQLFISLPVLKWLGLYHHYCHKDQLIFDMFSLILYTPDFSCNIMIFPYFVRKHIFQTFFCYLFTFSVVSIGFIVFSDFDSIFSSCVIASLLSQFPWFQTGFILLLIECWM